MLALLGDALRELFLLDVVTVKLAMPSLLQSRFLLVYHLSYLLKNRLVQLGDAPPLAVGPGAAAAVPRAAEPRQDITSAKPCACYGRVAQKLPLQPPSLHSRR